MKIICNCVAAALALCFIAGCMNYGAITTTIYADSSKRIGSDDRLYLDRKSSDNAGFQDVIEHKLLLAGFQLKPEIFVKESDEFVLKAKKAKDRMNDYVLEYTYHSRKTFLVGRTVVDRFEGKLMELSTKNKIADFKFEGKRSVESFADSLVNALLMLRLSQLEKK